MLYTALDPHRKFNYFVKREFPNDEIDDTKALYIIFPFYSTYY